ncbi:hypothetical protein EDD16DRAFT_1545620 [Pisolithus croceorrhizus]|nr:hypothetical protein EDD16DRAFT_1545620 [Pisolithus croceorrhizus]
MSINIILFGETGVGKSSVVSPDFDVGSIRPEVGVNGYIPAIEKAWLLIKRLREAGGVDLLLFCIRANRVTMTTQSNYRLFYEVLCGQQVPIALVITHLEREVDMEDWWTRNHKSIEKYGIKCAGHACRARTGSMGNHRRQSLACCNSTMDHGSGLKIFTAGRAGISKGKSLQKALVKRCGLDADTAQKIMETITDNDD